MQQEDKKGNFGLAASDAYTSYHDNIVHLPVYYNPSMMGEMEIILTVARY